MSQPTIRAVVFDWGGVFTEGTFDSSAVQALVNASGVDETTVAEHYYPLMAEFEVGAFDLSTFYQRLKAQAGLTLDEATFRDTFLGAVRERPAMFAVLGAIPSDYRVAMLSNNVPELCDSVRNDPRMVRVEQFVFSNEIGVRKPDPKAFAALTETLGVPPEEILFIDDNDANISACSALGFHGILFDSFDNFSERCRAHLPDVTFDIVS